MTAVTSEDLCWSGCAGAAVCAATVALGFSPGEQQFCLCIRARALDHSHPDADLACPHEKVLVLGVRMAAAICRHLTAAGPSLSPPF